MKRPQVMCVALADIVTDAPIVLCVGSEQASGYGYTYQAVSLPEFIVCTMPRLEQGMACSRCSVSIGRKYRGLARGSTGSAGFQAQPFSSCVTLLLAVNSS